MSLNFAEGQYLLCWGTYRVKHLINVVTMAACPRLDFRSLNYSINSTQCKYLPQMCIHNLKSTSRPFSQWSTTRSPIDVWATSEEV